MFDDIFQTTTFRRWRKNDDKLDTLLFYLVTLDQYYRITMFECTHVMRRFCLYSILYRIHIVSMTVFSLGQLFSVFTSFNVLNTVVRFTISLKPSPVFRELWKIPQAIHSWWGLCPCPWPFMSHGPAQIFSGISVKDFHLIDQLQQVILGGVHPHGPHGPAQLLRADVSTSVNVKLIEGLQQKCHIFGKRCKIGIIRWAKIFSKKPISFDLGWSPLSGLSCHHFLSSYSLSPNSSNSNLIPWLGFKDFSSVFLLLYIYTGCFFTLGLP